MRDVNKLIETTKLNYHNNILQNLNEMSVNKNKYWRLIKKLLGNKFVSNIPTMHDADTDTLCETNHDKSNLFLRTLMKKYHTDVA